MSAVYRNVYLSVLEVAFLTNLFLLSNLSNAASLIKLYILQKDSTISLSHCLLFALQSS